MAIFHGIRTSCQKGKSINLLTLERDYSGDPNSGNSNYENILKTDFYYNSDHVLNLNLDSYFVKFFKGLKKRCYDFEVPDFEVPEKTTLRSQYICHGKVPLVVKGMLDFVED